MTLKYERKPAMKKISAFILAVVMVASILSTCLVATSAAGNELAKSYDSAVDGDILYEVKFGQTDGAYKSTLWEAANKKVITSGVTTTFSDDGKTLTIDNTQSKAQAMYGGSIEGLELGADKSYTITMKVNFPTGNLGVYFNHPKTIEGDNEWSHTYRQMIRGYYGCPDVRSALSINGGKMTGKYISSGKRYVDENWGENPTVLFAKDADGFHDVTIEVEGTVFRVYINNTLFDEGTLPEENIAQTTLGFNIFVYNVETAVVKDVVVYKGAIQKNSATLPEYVQKWVDTTNPNSDNKLLADYATAKDGDLLYQVKFNATDGIYVPKVLDNYNSTDTTTVPTSPAYKDNPMCTFETSDDGYSITFSHTSFNAAWWYGNTIDGLKVNADTKYTYEFKVKNMVAKQNSGIAYVSSNTNKIGDAFNVYGTFTAFPEEAVNPTIVIERDSGKISGEYLSAGDTYTPIFPAYDAEGYATFRIEIDGYRQSIYIYTTDEGSTESYWKLFETYNMEDALYHTDSALSAIFYVHNKNANATYKDVKIYKGLIVDKSTPDETTTEAPTGTTPAATTPEATTPADTTTAAPTTTAPTTTAAEEKGCGSVVVGGIAVIAIVSLAGVAVSKKH